MKRNDVGQLHVWVYPDDTKKSYSGWHLTADRVECALLSDAISDLARGALNETRVFVVSPITPAVLAVPNNRRERARSPEGLRVALSADPEHFSLEERDNVLTIRVGSGRLEELRKYVIGITKNEGDFAMRPAYRKRCARDQALWFWW